MAFLAGLGRAMTALGQDLSFTKREDEERVRQEEAAEAERVRRNTLGRDLAGVSSGRMSPGSPGYPDLAGRAMEQGVDIGSYVPEPVVDQFSATGDYGGRYGRWNKRTGAFAPAPEGAPVPVPDAPRRGQVVTGEGGARVVVDPYKMGPTGVVAPVPEPVPTKWDRLPATEDGLMWERHPFTQEVRAVKGPDGVQLRHRPTGGGMSQRDQIVMDALGREESVTPEPVPTPDDLLERQQEWDDALAAGLARGMSREEVEGKLGPRPSG